LVELWALMLALPGILFFLNLFGCRGSFSLSGGGDFVKKFESLRSRLGVTTAGGGETGACKFS
jgi:hypothetical protein